MDSRTRAVERPRKKQHSWADVGRPVPRHAVIVAHLVPLTVLPSAIWRVVLATGVSTMGFEAAAVRTSGDIPGWGSVWPVFLTVLTEALALLTLGLVRPWGEIVPGWVPRLRGRRIPPTAVVVFAFVGGMLLTFIWIFALTGLLTGDVDHFTGGSGWWTLMIGCYLPAVLWGPLLIWVAFLYRRRRA